MPGSSSHSHDGSEEALAARDELRRATFFRKLEDAESVFMQCRSGGDAAGLAEASCGTPRAEGVLRRPVRLHEKMLPGVSKALEWMYRADDQDIVWKMPGGWPLLLVATR